MYHSTKPQCLSFHQIMCDRDKSWQQKGYQIYESISTSKCKMTRANKNIFPYLPPSLLAFYRRHPLIHFRRRLLLHLVLQVNVVILHRTLTPCMYASLYPFHGRNFVILLPKRMARTLQVTVLGPPRLTVWWLGAFRTSPFEWRAAQREVREESRAHKLLPAGQMVHQFGHGGLVDTKCFISLGLSEREL